MFRPVEEISEAWGYHLKGIKFAFKHVSFLFLSLLPFLITVALYVTLFFVLVHNADYLLDMIWKVKPDESSKYVAWLYWVYMHVIKFTLYLLTFIIMLYTFTVAANLFASPLYDFISTRYERLFTQSSNKEPSLPFFERISRVLKEEIKKSLFVFILPFLVFFIIPVIGFVLSFILAAAFIAWDYIDFSLSRYKPELKERLKTLWRFRYYFFGFGFPLLIPVLNIVFLPFSILGATILYFDKMFRAE